MEKLEDVLSEVENLRKDLSAKRFLKEGEENYKDSFRYYKEIIHPGEPTAWAQGSGNVCYPLDEGVSYVERVEVSKEEYQRKINMFHSSSFGDKFIAEPAQIPDEEKQESAKKQLQEIYDSSEWYSAKYIAGKDLGFKDNEPEGRLKKWVDELKEELKAEIVLQEEEGFTKSCPSGYSGINEDNYQGDFYIVTKERIAKPDEEKRKKAKQDLEILKKELKKTYNNSSFLEERIEAGKALGYSSLRIWHMKIMSR